MAGLGNDGSDKQITDNNVHEEANIHEDEVDLRDYFLVLWKYKWLVLLGSVLPALAVGLILFLSPKSYEVTYVYDVRDDVSGWNLNEINYNVFVSRFYSEENLNKITNKLCENDLNRYAKLINGGGGYLKEFVYFDIWPSYTDISKAKITELSQLKHIRQLNAQLLNVTIVARPRNDISKISSVIRDNLENVIPVYVV